MRGQVFVDLAAPKEFKINTSNALMLAIAPGIINIASVFLLHTGIYFALGLYYITLPICIANSFLPLIGDNKRDKKSRDKKTVKTPLRTTIRRPG